MTEAYYGTTPGARSMVEKILDINSSGQEQDWEIEFADPQKIDRILLLVEDPKIVLDLEERSALALLLLHSVEEAAEEGCMKGEWLARSVNFLRNNPTVGKRMHFYWTELAPSSSSELLEKILKEHANHNDATRPSD